MGKELVDGSDACGRVTVADESGGEHFEEIFGVAEEEIVFVAVVRVEGGAANVGAIEDVLDGDGLERLVVHKRDDGIAESVPGGADADIHLFLSGRGADFFCRG